MMLFRLSVSYFVDNCHLLLNVFGIAYKAQITNEDAVLVQLFAHTTTSCQLPKKDDEMVRQISKSPDLQKPPCNAL